MKRLGFVVVAVLLTTACVFAITACGGGQAEPATTQPAPSVTAATTSSTVPPPSSSTSSTQSQVLEQIRKYRDASADCIALADGAWPGLQLARDIGKVWTTASDRSPVVQGFSQINIARQNLLLLTPPKELEASHKLLAEGIQHWMNAANIVDDKPAFDEAEQSAIVAELDAGAADIEAAKALRQTELGQIPGL
jgi:hypothetical protein